VSSNSNWKPTTVGELKEAYQFDQGGLGWGKRLLVVLISLLTTIYRYPFLFLPLLVFFRDPSLFGAVSVGLLVLAGTFSRNIIFFIHSSNKLKEIISFLREDISRYFRVTRFPLEAYIDAKVLPSLRATRILSMVNTQSMGDVFVLEPKSENMEFPQRKGFVIPFTYKVKPASRLIELEPMSATFVRDLPEDLTLTGKFQILHEVGHMTNYAWKIQLRPYEAISNIIAVLFFSLVVENWTPQPFMLWMSPYLFFLVWITLSGSRNALKDEHVADMFAIKRIPLNQSERLQNLLSLVLPEERMKKIRTYREWIASGRVPNENSIVFEGQRARSLVTVFLIIGVFQLSPVTSSALIQLVVGLGLYYLALQFMRRVLRKHTAEFESLLRELTQA
jgi:hypothetical protein